MPTQKPKPRPPKPATLKLRRDEDKTAPTRPPKPEGRKGEPLAKAGPEPKQAGLSGAEQDDAPKSDDDKADSSIVGATANAIKQMIKKGKERGYVTLDEINAALPQDKINSDLIEDTMAMLSEMGISVTEGDDDEAPKAEKEGDGDEEEKEKEEKEGEKAATSTKTLAAPTIPCACICAKWARSSLLSREGEIAIAKRIEAGREMMISGICESPLTIQAILGWHDALNDGKMLLRDIIDLEATYGGAPTSESEMLGEGESAEARRRRTGRTRRRRDRRRL